MAIKYCDVKDIGAHNAYQKIFNDADAFKVITTCLHIMLDYWKKNPAISAFYAVPREWRNEVLINKSISPEKIDAYIENFKTVRFTIYHYAMVNLFSPVNFIHLRDTKNSIYILLNKKQRKPKTTLKVLGEYLLKNSGLIFELD